MAKLGCQVRLCPSGEVDGARGRNQTTNTRIFSFREKILESFQSVSKYLILFQFLYIKASRSSVLFLNEP
jgi:hypothetical protein